MKTLFGMTIDISVKRLKYQQNEPKSLYFTSNKQNMARENDFNE